MIFMKSTLFGFMMGIGWYAAKIIMSFCNDSVDRVIYKRKSKKILRSKYIK